MALSAAFIWGTSFVAQSVGAESMPPAAFNTFRFIVAFAFLLIFCAIINFIREKNNIPSQANKKDPRYLKNLLTGGGLCGPVVLQSERRGADRQYHTVSAPVSDGAAQRGAPCRGAAGGAVDRPGAAEEGVSHVRKIRRSETG